MISLLNVLGYAFPGLLCYKHLIWLHEMSLIDFKQLSYHSCQDLKTAVAQTCVEKNQRISPSRKSSINEPTWLNVTTMGT